MHRNFKFIVPTVLAGLLAACSGGDTGGGTSTGPSRLLATTGTATSWTSVKWGAGGYVTGIVYHPTNSSVMYARTDIGGIYRWNNSNGSWTPLNDSFSAAEQTYLGVESIGLDPTNDQKVYMVARKSVTEGNGRIYISNDRGNTWTHFDLPFPVGGNNSSRAIGERLKLDPTNPSTMFYASRTAGLWKSTDSGQTWTQTGLSSRVLSASEISALSQGDNAPVGVEQIMLDNSAVGGGGTTWIMYAAIAPDYVQKAGLTSTIYKSVNGGFSWTPVTVDPAVAGYYVPHMVRASDGTYYVVFNKNAGQSPSGPSYLYKFSNGTWTQLAASTQGSFNGVSVYGTGATARVVLAVTNTWCASCQTVQLSDAGGTPGTFHEISGGMTHWGGGWWGWVNDIEIDPGNRDHIMYTTGNGVWETWNASSATPSWDFPNNNLEMTGTVAAIAAPAGASYKFINSAGDIGTWVQTDLAATPTRGPTTDWSHGYGADMAWSDPNYIAIVGQINQTQAQMGYWSGDGGNSWSQFASNAPGATTANTFASSIAVTSRNNAIWAPGDVVPSYTTSNGASWVATNLPSMPSAGVGIHRAYRVVADRKNPAKVYAYDSGGAFWQPEKGKVYVSMDGGHTFALSQGSVSANMGPNFFSSSSMVVNPNAEGDVWVADGNAVYHSTNSGSTWTKVGNFATVSVNGVPQFMGASSIALGKAMAGASYSAAIYVVGTLNGVPGLYHSDDGGQSWARFNDDAHQFGGFGVVTADWTTYGRVYISAPGRGMLYTN